MAGRYSNKSKKDNRLGNTIVERGLEGLNRFYGIYRGLVMENKDPLGLNRLYIWIPEVMGGITRWALPRGQQGGAQYGFKKLAPQVQEIVYVTFEYGDASKPLWEPHGWSTQEVPGKLKEPDAGGFVTPNGNMCLFDEKDNTLHLYFKGSIYIHSGSSVVLSSDSILSLKSEKGVVLNGGKNGGIINSEDLTAKLNQLITELETVKTQINTHTHNCTAPGSPSGPPIIPISQIFSQFISLDYEDEKALH